MIVEFVKNTYLAGIEPTTYCLEGNCSIQLSYRYLTKAILSVNGSKIKDYLTFSTLINTPPLLSGKRFKDSGKFSGRNSILGSLSEKPKVFK